MPLDVLGRTRATMIDSTSFFPWPKGLGNLLKINRAGDRPLQLLVFNEEFLVSASHQLVLITSLLFVLTARRLYRLDDPVKISDDSNLTVGETLQYCCQKLFKPYHLEEQEVVTRFP
jgi:hypothetical protein